MCGRRTSLSGVKPMFNETKFWNTFIIIIASLIVVYAIVDIFVLRKLPKRSKNQTTLINGLLILGFASIMVLLIDSLGMFLFLQTIMDKVLGICVLALATTGIVLIFKTSMTTNFAQGSMATLGAFFAARYILYLTATTTLTTIQKVFLAILVSALVAFILGILIDVFIIRKAKHVTSVGKQMITMGLVLVISGLIPVTFGGLPLEIPRLSYDIVPVTLFGQSLSIPQHSIYALYLTVIVLVVLFAALRFTKWGLGVRATASNEIVAKMMGVNTRIITAMSWAIAGALGGLASVLAAPFGGQVTTGLMVSYQVNGFMASILGGFSSFGGPLVGAILIPLLQGLLFYFSNLWQNAIVYLIILLIVLAKPLGLFGKKIAKKV
ncbi:MAG: branched-chain amino acid ABC transporter permease [Tenericutes bacterium HGW-Tenericutes-1]|nr:MAG: branched-chain amino acid ABC transporter permease [Tenericutes bacterium HGW-Tenericutes-1]